MNNMKLALFFLLFTGIASYSCKTNPSEKSKESTSGKPNAENNTQKSTAAQKIDCYSFFGTKDTVYLQLTDTYGTLAGFLVYKHQGKPNVVGSLQGKMKGNLLFADYTFKTQKGETAVRQIVFKKEGDAFFEGYGRVNFSPGKVAYEDVNALEYNPVMAIKKIPCTN
jgi:hypothetical protein